MARNEEGSRGSPGKAVQWHGKGVFSKLRKSDGKRVYYTSSLLANWDKQAPAGPDLQYLKIYDFDGKSLRQTLALDFIEAKLGAPHQMRFGAYALYGNKVAAQ